MSKDKRPPKVKDKALKKAMRGGQGFMKTLFSSEECERIINTAALSARKAKEDVREEKEEAWLLHDFAL